MKVQVLLMFFVVVVMVTVKAQRCPLCPQGVCRPTCTGELNVGNNCTTARPRRMWYFNSTSRSCTPMAHLGCGGNNNRWCSLLGCTLRCVLQLG